MHSLIWSKSSDLIWLPWCVVGALGCLGASQFWYPVLPYLSHTGGKVNLGHMERTYFAFRLHVNSNGVAYTGSSFLQPKYYRHIISHIIIVRRGLITLSLIITVSPQEEYDITAMCIVFLKVRKGGGGRGNDGIA